ncbi:MAG TPA: tetratricopeptide repeat protein [Patescibacteria group bacterium]|nr:tetratricopeptide repeat protein [Patescibacteria group bacterium]
MLEPQNITRLFAVEAEKLLAAGQADEAVQLCEMGLVQYPDYPTAYGILARAYKTLGDADIAVEAIERGLERFPLNKFLLRLKREIYKVPATVPQENRLKNKEVTAEIIQENAAAEEFFKSEVATEEEIEAATVAKFALAPEEELIIDEEVITENDVENPAELEADPAVIEISEIESECEREEFEKVFKNDEQEDLIIDEEVISEDDVENPVELEADPAVIEVSKGEAEEEREEFEEVFKTGNPIEGESSTEAKEVLKEMPLKEDFSKVESFPASANDVRYSPLRIIETFKKDETQRKSLKSASVRLIPGLEFAPLRFESSKKYDRHISALPEPPPFRTFKTIQRVNYAVTHPSMFHRMEQIQQPETSGNLIQRRAQEAGFVAQNLTPLEELATRLEKARIPVVKEDIDPQLASLTREPSVVTDTMATIYEMQGALAEALKAYQVLARQKPEKLEYYEGKIQEIKKRLQE